MSLVIDLIDLVAKHKAGELRCPATALITCMHFSILPQFLKMLLIFMKIKYQMTINCKIDWHNIALTTI